MREMEGRKEGRIKEKKEGREWERKEERKNERDGAGARKHLRASVPEERGAWNAFQYFGLLMRINQ